MDAVTMFRPSMETPTRDLLRQVLIDKRATQLHVQRSLRPFLHHLGAYSAQRTSVVSLSDHISIHTVSKQQRDICQIYSTTCSVGLAEQRPFGSESIVIDL